MPSWIRATISLAIIVPAMSLEAQRPLSIGLAGGVSLPQGNLSDAASTGWHGLATLALSSLVLPQGVRVDIAYNQFAFSDDAQTQFGSDGNVSVGSATLNLTYRLPMTNSPMSPYLITGLGAYQSKCSGGPACEASTRFGWNVGLGSKLAVLGTRTFVEARYHVTSRGGGSIRYFPVTLGLLF
jgi:hypothetical protein